MRTKTTEIPNFLRLFLLLGLQFMTWQSLVHSTYSPQLPINVILGQLQCYKVSCYIQFVQETLCQMKASYLRAGEYIWAQYACQQWIHDHSGLSEEFQIGDKSMIVHSCGHMKKFKSCWKGPYTILDKPGAVYYQVQIIGGIQQFMVHCSGSSLPHCIHKANTTFFESYSES